jgi:hypothetical protein
MARKASFSAASNRAARSSPRHEERSGRANIHDEPVDHAHQLGLPRLTVASLSMIEWPSKRRSPTGYCSNQISNLEINCGRAPSPDIPASKDQREARAEK